MFRAHVPIVVGIALAVAVAACAPSATGPQASSASPTSAASASLSANAPTATPVVSPQPSKTADVPTIALAGASAEPALRELWAAGGPKPSQPCTYSPTVDAKGEVWVAVCWDSRFWIVGPDGKFREAWGTTGAKPGQFDFAYPAAHDSIGGIAFAHDGTFYTFDAGNLRVQHFAADRSLIGSWGSFGNGKGQFAKPTSIAIGPDGSVFVADGARSDVQVFSPSGEYIRTAATHVGGSGQFAYIAVDPASNLFVNVGSRIGVYGKDGTEIRIIDTKAVAPHPAGMAVGPNGTLYVVGRSDSGVEATLQLGTDGKLLHWWPGTGESIAVSPKGDVLYVADVESESLHAYALPKP